MTSTKRIAIGLLLSFCIVEYAAALSTDSEQPIEVEADFARTRRNRGRDGLQG